MQLAGGTNPFRLIGSAVKRAMQYLVSILVAALCGLLYAWYADWWVYVETGLSREPKFRVPLTWRVAESIGVGAACGLCVLGMLVILRSIAEGRRRGKLRGWQRMRRGRE